MLENIKIIKNVGKLKNVSLKETIPGFPVVLVYAENGCGKTTLSSILRSLATNDGALIASRRRLEGPARPQISLGIGGASYNYTDRSWREANEDIKVYDDTFIDENVHSGMNPSLPQRQNLHKLITLGEGRIKLYAQLEDCKRNVKKMERELGKKEKAVAEIANLRGMKVAEYCSLACDDAVEGKISDCERNLSAVKASEIIQRKRVFSPLSLPDFDITAVGKILSAELQEIQSNSLKQALGHISNLGEGGETWMREGMEHLQHLSSKSGENSCPFCLQSLDDISIVQLFQHYFSKEYNNLKDELEDTIRKLVYVHRDQKHTQLQAEYFDSLALYNYWKNLIPGMQIDDIEINEVLETWRGARDAVLKLLQIKLAAPTQAVTMDKSFHTIIKKYNRHRSDIKKMSQTLLEHNKAIDLLKQETASGNSGDVENQLNMLKCQKERHEKHISQACEEYLTAAKNKSFADKEQQEAEERLKDRGDDSWIKMEKSINKYLKIFGTNFQIRDIRSADDKLHFEADYEIEICGKRVGLAPRLREPSFKTVLSSGDRSTLSLAFFISHLEIQWKESIGKKIVIFDDPVASLDEHRERDTIRTICELSGQVRQIIVLSHSRPFVINLFNACSKLKTSSGEKVPGEAPIYKLVRQGEASQIKMLGIEDLYMPDNSSRRKQVWDYLQNETPADYDTIGGLLRSILEHTMLSNFGEYRNKGDGVSTLAKNMTRENLMSSTKLKDFEDLYEFACSFHHTPEDRNDRKLSGYCERTLQFQPQGKDDDDD